MKYKYMFNSNTGTLHIIDRCMHSKLPKSTNQPYDKVLFKTEDDAIVHAKRYMKYCKLCFKNRD